MIGKSLLKEITGFLNKKSETNNNISAAKALTLQQEYLTQGRHTPQSRKEPFLTIIPQIEHESDEVASAALFYLKKIATNSPTLAKDIVDSLDEHAKNSRITKTSAKRFSFAAQEIRNTIKLL